MAMFNRVAIIGVGLLGGSFGLALKKHGLAKHIVGVTRRDDTAQLAMELGAVDSIAANAEKAVEGADLVMIATPMLVMEKVIAVIAPHINKHAIITDVGSVKSSLVSLIENKYPDLRKQCVFAHPIAGGEKHSVAASNPELFVGKHLILTDTGGSDAELVIKIESLWSKLGSHTVQMTSQEHDKVFAYTSHLPHVVAYTLVNNLHQQDNSKDLFNFASAGFYDFTRIASSDPIMWRDICLSNREEVIESIDGFASQLGALRKAVEANDGEKLAEVFSDAKRARDMGLIAKTKKS